MLGISRANKRLRRKINKFEHRMMQSAMPYREKMMSGMYNTPAGKDKNKKAEIPISKIESGFEKARLYSYIDISLEALNLSLVTVAAAYFFGIAGSRLDSFIRDITLEFGLQVQNNTPKWILLLASATMSKAIVKIGCWIETFQMFQIEALVRKTGAIEKPSISHLLNKYSNMSLREQVKDAIIILVPLPFIELIRRKTAINSKILQLTYIKKLEGMVLAQIEKRKDSSGADRTSTDLE